MHQFPADITSDVTIWLRYVDNLTNNNINVRCVLHNCFWNDDSISTFHKNGTQVVNSATVFIPLRASVTGKTYVTPERWAELSYGDLDQYWTFNMQRLPLMVKGENYTEFNWGTAGFVQTAENQLSANNPSVRRATDFNMQAFGSESMRHAVIRA